MKKIAFLNQAISPISIDIINSFQSQGMSVTLYTGSPSPAQTGLHSAVHVKQQIDYRPTSTLQRIWTWSAFSVATLFALAWKRRPYEIFAVTNPPFNLFTALLLNKTLGVKYHLLLFDIYPDAAIQYRYFRKGKLIDRTWSWLNKICFANASNIFTISDRMCDTVRRYTAPDTAIKVVHNWADNAAIHPIKKEDNSFLAQHGISHQKTVLYSGNFGKTHDLGSIVEAAKLLRCRNDIHFLLIGDGDQKERIIDLVKQYELRNVTVLPYVDRATFRFSVASGDVTIVTLDTQAESVSTPSKTYCAMAAGSAIVAVASLRSELADLVLKHNMGVVVEPGNASVLAQTLEQLLDDDARLATLADNARRASNDYTPLNAEIYSKAVAGKLITAECLPVAPLSQD